MGKKLYIIGNGFDLAHGIPTRYRDYHEWLKAEGEQWMMDMLEFYFGNEPGEHRNILWSDLERALGVYSIKDIYDFLRGGHKLDIDHVMRSVGEVEAEVQYHFVEICHKFNETFARWCRSIDLTSASKLSLFNFTPSDRFLTFNYSDTLEKVYGVAESQILHIHGRAVQPNDEMIVGHNRPATMPQEIEEDFYDHEANYKAIIDTVNKLEKKTREIIGRNRKFFNAQNDVKEVVVVGHSVADVDMPYFEVVKKNIASGANWRFSYYNDIDVVHIHDVAAELGLDTAHYSVFHI